MLDIKSLIPQKPPFVMIDKLLSCDENATITSFRVLADNVMVTDGEFTEGGLMENMAQTAAARAGYMAQRTGESVKDGYIAFIKNLEILRLPKVGDELLTEVKITDQVFGMTVISGTVTCNNVIQAKCEMSIFEGK
jgi:predicted hotdog family 3-hydroxylacyl-ACP dehydratase